MPYTPPTFADPLPSLDYRVAAQEAVEHVRAGLVAGSLGPLERGGLAPQSIVLRGEQGFAWRGVSGCGEARTPQPTFSCASWEWQPLSGYTLRLPVERAGVLDVSWQLWAEVGPDDAPSPGKPAEEDRYLRVALSVAGDRKVYTTGDHPNAGEGWALSPPPKGASVPYEISGGTWVGGSWRQSVGVGTLSIALVSKATVDRALVPHGTLIATVTYGI